ncbi:MAG: alkaline phosphatase family protein, partial [Thermoplasmata archaeon]
YGFRHRRPGTYWDMYLPTSRMLREPAVWDELSRIGRRVCVIGMPPGFPPPPVNGVYVSDFLTPDSASEYVFPAARREEVERAAGGYEFDVPFRAEDRERIGAALVRLTRKHFAVARHLWSQERWDFFALHEIGPDRLHHTFWKYIDPSHPHYQDHAAFREIVEGYYAMLDAEIGAFLQSVPPEVRVIVVSDHGSQAMAGAFRVNDWLIREGHLALRGPRPAPGKPIESADVDWSRTRAWGAGGYYARIFYNVRGREPEGLLAPEEVPGFEARLREEFRAIRGPDGASLNVDPRSPREIYREVRGDAPDLLVYFGDLRWRAVGTVGHDSLFVEENDKGPDDAVHSFDGVYAVTGPREGVGARGPTERIIDIAPTILDLMGVPVPSRIQGRRIERFRS